MTSPKNEHAHITRFQLRSLDELAQRPKHLQRKITALAFTATLAASALWAEFHDVDRFPSQ